VEEVLVADGKVEEVLLLVADGEVEGFGVLLVADGKVGEDIMKERVM